MSSGEQQVEERGEASSEKTSSQGEENQKGPRREKRQWDPAWTDEMTEALDQEGTHLQRLEMEKQSETWAIFMQPSDPLLKQITRAMEKLPHEQTPPRLKRVLVARVSLAGGKDRTKLSRLRWPTWHVAATWCHRKKLFFNVSDEDLRKNIEAQVERGSAEVDNVAIVRRLSGGGSFQYVRVGKADCTRSCGMAAQLTRPQHYGGQAQSSRPSCKL